MRRGRPRLQGPVEVERFTDLLFLAQVALLFGILSWWLSPGRHPGRAMLAMTLWVALLGFFSLEGYFANFKSLPPRILPALLIPLIAGLLFLRSGGVGESHARPFSGRSISSPFASSWR